MNISYRVILIIFAVFMGGIFYWAIFSPKEELSDRIYKTIKEQEKKADVTFKEVSFDEVVSGSKYWSLFAQKATINKTTGIATLSDSSGTILKKGKPTMYFVSRAAVWDRNKQEILLGGQPKMTIKTETNVPVTMEAKTFKVISDKDVIMARGEPRIRWREAEITADKMDYAQEIKTLLLTGNVVIKYRDILAWGDHARYLTEKEKIVLGGNARATQGENNLSGENVVVSLKNQKVSVEGKGKVIISEESVKKE